MTLHEYTCERCDNCYMGKDTSTFCIECQIELQNRIVDLSNKNVRRFIKRGRKIYNMNYKKLNENIQRFLERSIL